MPRIANEELACDQDQGSLVGLCMEDYNKSLRAAVITICATDTHTHTHRQHLDCHYHHYSHYAHAAMRILHHENIYKYKYKFIRHKK